MFPMPAYLILSLSLSGEIRRICRAHLALVQSSSSEGYENITLPVASGESYRFKTVITKNIHCTKVRLPFKLPKYLRKYSAKVPNGACPFNPQHSVGTARYSRNILLRNVICYTVDPARLHTIMIHSICALGLILQLQESMRLQTK